MNRISIKYLALIVVAAALTACGGGGDPAPTTPEPTTPSAAAPKVTTVPTPTYTGEELAAFTALNNARSTCGFGLLKQDTRLDQAAVGHADWQIYNRIAAHFQTADTPLFTGVTPLDRIRAQGYTDTQAANVQDEFVYGTGTNDKTGFGAFSIKNLLNAPYHAAGVLGGFRDVGIAVRNMTDAGATDASSGRRVTVLNPAFQNSAGSQQAAYGDNDVFTYPCAGSTNVARALYNEYPNPTPGRDLAVEPLGTTIHIAIKEGRQLVITGASVTPTAGGQPLAMATSVTSSNDPNAFFKPHQGYVAANAPLAANTTYQADIAGTSNGVAFSRSFSFTTGN